MAINPLIPMQGQPVDLGQAAALGVNAYQGAQRNALLQQNQELQKPLIEAQTQAAQQALTKEQALFQLGDAAVDAIQLKPLLASDPQRAIAAMDARITKIRERGGDPSDTMALREGLASRQLTPEQVVAELDSVIDAAGRYGALGEGTQGVFAPQAAFDAQGNPVFIQGSKQGGVSLLQGYRPYTPTLDEQTRAAIIKAQQLAPISVAEAGGKRAAEAAVDMQTKPQIEAATTTAKTTAEESAKRGAAIIKAIGEEKEVGRILDIAEPLLDKATQSLAGVAMDQAGRLIGVSSEGARTASQLKTLEGALIMKMPRMEGPQSNLDQQLYRQMAAQIGDATIPADQRKAAMDTLRELNRRYTGNQNTAPNQTQPSPSMPSVGQEFDAGGVVIKRIK